MKFLVDSYTDIGGRENNEDSFCICESENGILAIVADGLGGYRNGEVASSLAVNSLKTDFKKNEFEIISSIRDINNKIIEKQKETSAPMKTTISAVWIKADKTVFAHVGDSRIYAFERNKLVYQSVDHSSAQLAALIGEISAEDIRKHPDRNILTRALGVSEDVCVDVSEVENQSYDALLLCTDGFWEYVLEDEMIGYKLVSDTPEVWIRNMRGKLAKRITGNNDNNTAVALVRKGD